MTPKIIPDTQALKKILTPHHSIVFEIKDDDKKFISINQTKLLNQKLNLSSASPQTIETYLIHQAHKLTLEAQNNLLKTLEETPKNKQIILITPQPNTLALTILSRCQFRFKKTPPPVSKQTNFFPPLSSWKAKPGQIPNLTDQILKSNNPAEYLCLALSRIKPTTPARIKLIKHLHNCLINLKQNANPKLTLDHFFINLL